MGKDNNTKSPAWLQAVKNEDSSSLQEKLSHRTAMGASRKPTLDTHKSRSALVDLMKQWEDALNLEIEKTWLG